jgi:hypothetical protein
MAKDLFDEAGAKLMDRDRRGGPRPPRPSRDSEPSEQGRPQVLGGLRDLVGGVACLAVVIAPVLKYGLALKWNAPIWLVGLIGIIGFLLIVRGVLRIAGRA